MKEKPAASREENEEKESEDVLHVFSLLSRLSLFPFPFSVSETSSFFVFLFFAQRCKHKRESRSVATGDRRQKAETGRSDDEVSSSSFITQRARRRRPCHRLPSPWRPRTPSAGPAAPRRLPSAAAPEAGASCPTVLIFELCFFGLRKRVKRERGMQGRVRLF